MSDVNEFADSANQLYPGLIRLRELSAPRGFDVEPWLDSKPHGSGYNVLRQGKGIESLQRFNSEAETAQFFETQPTV